MGTEGKILHPKGRIRGGAILPHLKDTAEIKTVVMPAVSEVRIGLKQHIGAPAIPVVKKGDKVYIGTLIAQASGFVSANMHSSVSGNVKDVLEDCIIIESDGKMENDPCLKPFEADTPEDIAAAAEACGLVGLGGAGFPAKVKLTIKEDTPIDTLIINAAECEPYITSDYRECMENSEDVIEGACLLKKIFKIPDVIICIEKNKGKAVKMFNMFYNGRDDNEEGIKLMELPTRYPQGAEKVIIYSATGRKVPAGKLPADVGCLVMNVTSVATLYRFISTGMPLVSKRITVDGSAVSQPQNVMVPIGTPIKDVLEFVGGIDEEADEIIMGGPMMGIDVYDENAVIEKRNNAITVMKAPKKSHVQTACIKCGRCADACPMQLYPARVESAVSFGKYEALEKLNVSYCIECGSCSFVCPAGRPLTQVMRMAKSEIKKGAAK